MKKGRKSDDGGEWWGTKKVEIKNEGMWIWNDEGCDDGWLK